MVSSNLHMVSLECLVVVETFVRKLSQAYHSIFYCHASLGKCVYPILLVDDIVITGNNTTKKLPSYSNQRSWVFQILPRH